MESARRRGSSPRRPKSRTRSKQVWQELRLGPGHFFSIPSFGGLLQRPLEPSHARRVVVTPRPLPFRVGQRPTRRFSKFLQQDQTSADTLGSGVLVRVEACRRTGDGAVVLRETRGVAWDRKWTITAGRAVMMRTSPAPAPPRGGHDGGRR